MSSGTFGTAGSFDRDRPLSALLDPGKANRWAAASARSLGLGVSIVDDGGEVLASALPLTGAAAEAASLALSRLAARLGGATSDASLSSAEEVGEVSEDGFRWRSASLRSGGDPVGYLLLGPRRTDAGELGSAADALVRLRPGTLQALLAPLRESLEWVIHAELSRAMVSDLHLETVETTHQDLAMANQRLSESEARLEHLVEDLGKGIQQASEEALRAQREAFLRERQAGLGRMAAGVAHEINNPLSFVASNLGAAGRYLEDLTPLLRAVQQLADGTSPSADLSAELRRIDLPFLLQDFRELLADARAGASRVSRIVRDLKDFSRVDRAAEDDVDLTESVQAAVRLAAGRCPEGVSLVSESSGPTPVRGDGGALNQALWNLLENALWAAAQGGSGVVARCGSTDGEAWFEVEDDGPGVPEECLPLLFDAFFTTKEVGQGAGLGLTVVRDVAAAHGGRVVVDSPAAGGARFRVTLPRRAPPTDVTDKRSP